MKPRQDFALRAPAGRSDCGHDVISTGFLDLAHVTYSIRVRSITNADSRSGKGREFRRCGVQPTPSFQARGESK